MFYNNYKTIIQLLSTILINWCVSSGFELEESREKFKELMKEELTPEQYTLFLLAFEEQ